METVLPEELQPTTLPTNLLAELGSLACAVAEFLDLVVVEQTGRSSPVPAKTQNTHIQILKFKMST